MKVLEGYYSVQSSTLSWPASILFQVFSSSLRRVAMVDWSSSLSPRAAVTRAAAPTSSLLSCLHLAAKRFSLSAYGAYSEVGAFVLLWQSRTALYYKIVEDSETYRVSGGQPAALSRTGNGSSRDSYLVQALAIPKQRHRSHMSSYLHRLEEVYAASLYLVSEWLVKAQVAASAMSALRPLNVVSCVYISTFRGRSAVLTLSKFFSSSS